MDKKKRLREVLGAVMAFLGFVVLDLIAYCIFGKGVPCLFYQFTGLQCPGCGMTHAGMALLSGDWKAAFEYNMLMFTFFPIGGIYLGYRAVKYVQTGEESFKVWEYIFLMISLVFVIGFGILRNR